MKRRLKTIAIFPTLFTLGNLVCGFFAIVVASRVTKPELLPESLKDVPPGDIYNLMLAGWLIFLAMVFDALDGHVARLSGAMTDFGAELDSLCDLVTFGVAPAVLMVKLCPRFTFLHREAIWVIAAVYVACAALRLARFNVETTEEEDHLHFSGLPSPAAAASIAGFAIFFYTLSVQNPPLAYSEQIYALTQSMLPFFGPLVSLLMVSRIPYPHLMTQIFHGQRSFGHLVAVIFTLMLIMIIRGYSVPILCTVFVLSGPVHFGWAKVFEKRMEQEEVF